MLSLDRDMVSVILISLDIGLPIVGLFAAVFGLAVVFHSRPASADATATSSVLTRILTDDASRAAGALLEGREPADRVADSGTGTYHMPI